MSSYEQEMLSGLFPGDLELFPECTLSNEGYKDEPVFDDLPFGKSLNSFADNGLADEEFPSWLDLKMDLSLLEGLESPDLVLDDLLLGDVTNGQSPDILPALQCQGHALPAHQQLPHEHSDILKNNVLVDTISPPLTPVSVVEVTSPPQSPPSSPDWCVPDMGLPSSPISVFSPASPGTLSTTTSPGPSSPAFIASAPVAHTETVLTFVAPIVQPVINATVGQAVMLESLLGLSFIIDNSQLQSETPSEESAPSSPVVTKAKKERKRRTPYSKASKRAKSSADDEDLEYVAVPTNKKERKRMQNKDAATRYRMKKRMESGTLVDQEQELEEENRKLKEKALQLANEMGYLKKLMREMFKARGLIL